MLRRMLGRNWPKSLPGFEVPVERREPKYLFTITPKEPFAEPRT